MLLATAVAFELLPSERNGALNAYSVWCGTLVIELGILGWMAMRPEGAPAALPPPVRSP